MSVMPFVIWALAVVAALVIYIGVAKAIEKTGLPRLGATGKLFTCDPEKGEKREVK